MITIVYAIGAICGGAVVGFFRNDGAGVAALSWQQSPECF